MLLNNVAAYNMVKDMKDYKKQAGIEYDSERRGRVPIIDSNEPLAQAPQIVNVGLLLTPFWETSNDLEGECYKSYITNHPSFCLAVRQGVLDRLIAAQRLLPTTWKIELRAGYRPISVQQELFKVFKRFTAQQFPELSVTEHLAYARQYVSDPTLTVPPHSTGGAIDLEIRNTETGELIDMGCRANEDGPKAAFYGKGLTTKQAANRSKLLNAMCTAGFANMAAEWWHFSYGDQRWALFWDKPVALYNIIRED